MIKNSKNKILLDVGKVLGLVVRKNLNTHFDFFVKVGEKIVKRA